MTTPNSGHRMPGLATERTASARRVVLADPVYLPRGRVIDGAKARENRVPLPAPVYRVYTYTSMSVNRKKPVRSLDISSGLRGCLAT